MLKIREFGVMWIISFLILFLIDMVIYALLLGNYTYSVLEDTLRPIKQTPYWPFIIRDAINAGILYFLLTKLDMFRQKKTTMLLIGGLIGLMNMGSYELANFATVPNWNLILLLGGIIGGVVLYALSTVLIVMSYQGIHKKEIKVPGKQLPL